MLTSYQARAARNSAPAVDHLIYAVCHYAILGNSNAGFDIAFEALNPLFMGLLPDYTSRPSDAEAGAYAVSMFEGSRAMIWDIQPNGDYPLAVDVILFVKGEGDDINVTVWRETAADGSTYLYGEW